VVEEADVVLLVDLPVEFWSVDLLVTESGHIAKVRVEGEDSVDISGCGVRVTDVLARGEGAGLGVERVVRALIPNIHIIDAAHAIALNAVMVSHDSAF
jgi:hypothetical protein